MTGISIETDGSGWLGTFALSVAAAADFILSDGSPVDGVIVNLADGSVVSGQLTAAGNGYLVIAGRAIEVEDLTRFQVT